MDNWQAPFYNGAVCYDSDAKELVKVSNGRCTKPHGTQEPGDAPYDGHMSNGGCVYAPSEAVALRVVGLAGKGDPVVAFTYRAVRPAALTVVEDVAWLDLSKFRRSRFVGRV